MRRLPLLVFGCFLAFGCASTRTASTTSTAGKYTEDLSVWRPETEKAIDSAKATVPERTRTNRYVPAKFAVNEQVDAILDSIHDRNLDRGYVDGFTIQVYSGGRREDALNIRKTLAQSLPDLQSNVEYKQPNFRVLSGKYFSRLEAQQDYLAVKKYFPNAIVIPDRVPIE